MSLNQIVEAFRNLAQRLERCESAAVKSDHLGKNVGATMVQAGYLIIEAIDAGVFPESRKEANAGWWSRKHARIPGGPVAWYDTIQKAFNEECRGESSSFKLDVIQQPSTQSAHGVWIHTIGWLARSFPSRLRHQAAASNWTHIAKDEHGRWLGKDGTPLKGNWYFNGELLPDDFKPAPGEFKPGFQWRLDGDFLYEHERFDEADHLNSQRIRAEVSQDACSLLAELIGAAASDINESQDSRDPAKQTVTALPVEKAASQHEVKPLTDWRDVQRRLFKMYDRGDLWPGYEVLEDRLTCSRATIQKAIKPPQSALSALSESDRKEAVEVGRKLAGWRARHTNSKGSPRASSLTEIVLDNAEQIREPNPSRAAEMIDEEDAIFNRLIQEAKTDQERAELHSMSPEKRRTVIAMVRDDPDRGDRILGRHP